MLTVEKTILEEYNELPEGAKYQLIKGKIIEMPSPTYYHQRILFQLALKIGNFLTANNIGIVCFAPLDVHLDQENVFQPDMLFIANENRHIVKQTIYGAPDLVVEILSPSTAYYDWEEKKEMYAQYGVKEYWIINPEKQYIEIYKNKNLEFEMEVKIKKQGIVVSEVIAGFTFELADLFKES